MPQSTEVGQSGPPTRMETLSMLRPGLDSTMRIVRTVSEFTPT
eukprot:CAMPEP_0205908462 /NCGR_PEP_ID=MMETSP1325-20131115/3236_1 /ASSEMBLY_ACC=CAM_ASM_000708 /TAXON_ID=236786 /ORGANISM="Florenciella sp., Strain RCC1007" /LENGTH=42 /DNA_ID= /DNA_START= /DNA_END= /DNA_ORIENTATION=